MAHAGFVAIQQVADAPLAGRVGEGRAQFGEGSDETGGDQFIDGDAVDQLQAQFGEAGAIGLSRAGEANQALQTVVMQPFQQQASDIGGYAFQVLGDLMHFVQDDVLHVGPLQEHLDGVDIEAALAHCRPCLGQGGVRHQQNGGMTAGALLEAFQLVGRARKDHLGRETQADRFVAQLARPLLLIIAGGHEDEDGLAGAQILQPVLDAHHADHGFAAAGGRFHQLPVVAITAEDSVGFVLIRTRVGRANKVGVAPGAGSQQLIFEQRLDQIGEEHSARFAHAGDLTERLPKSALSPDHIAEPRIACCLQPAVDVRSHQGAQAGGVDIHFGVSALRVSIESRALAHSLDITRRRQILEMPLHSSLAHAHYIQIVHPLHDSFHF